MKIPIENIYFMLCYAWNALEQKDLIYHSPTKANSLYELLARVLCSQTERVFKSGLDRSFKDESETTSVVSGKIDFGASLNPKLILNGRLVCEKDIFSSDILQNQIIKSTFRFLLNVKDLNSDLKDSIAVGLRFFEPVQEVELSSRLFRNVILNSNNREYEFLMHICELIFENLIPTETKGEYLFADFIRKKTKMAKLFQDFIRFYCERHFTEFTVNANELSWDSSGTDPVHHSYLPVMRTDIYLRSKKRNIVVDTKFYKETLQSYHETKKVHSNHLYQICAYLNSTECRDEKNIEGMLLYPMVAESLRLSFKIQNRFISVNTVNLNQNWEGIQKELNGIFFNQEAIKKAA